LCACLSCGFLFNATFDPGLVVYDQQYSNTQAYAPSFDRYLDQVAQTLLEKHGVRQCRIIEIGCGDGLLLERLVQRGNNQGWGFDPSYRGPTTHSDGRLQFVTEYYDERFKEIATDVIICRHVLEHLAHPGAFLRQLRQTCSHAQEIRCFFETPDVEWILQTGAFWDIYYEHCNYFSASSLTLAFRQAGFHVKNIHHVFGGQYLWLEATTHHPTGTHTNTCTVRGSLKSQLHKFQKADHDLRQAWMSTLHHLAAQGPVAVLGAAGKGVTFVNLLDPDCTLIACVVDGNPRKQGMFLPGTGHPIVGYHALSAFGITSAILLNPSYREDALEQCAASGLQIRLIEAASEEEGNGIDRLD
jgi:2-polyprenyl-3-methyl-5-hydroxy-6-metoxy-1,4-benzoquinol methylase